MEFESCENKVGGVMGLFCFSQTVGYALGGWIAGIALSLIGYNAALTTYEPDIVLGINY